MTRGNLLLLLKEDSDITVNDMIDIAKQAASGMAYLQGNSLPIII